MRFRVFKLKGRELRKQIAVGNLGEFWYGNYKEPFETFEGGVPDYPRGVLLDDGTEAQPGRLLCAYCGKAFDNLGSHVNKTHKMTARAYKTEVGLSQSSALVSETGRISRIRNGLRLRARGLGFQKGQVAVGRITRGPRSTEVYNKVGLCYQQVLETCRQELRERGRLTATGLTRRRIRAKVVRRYFGSYENLRRVIGAAPSSRDISNAQLLLALRSIAQELARTPSASDMRRYGLSHGQFERRFGSWAEACRAAGLNPNLRLAPTSDDDRDVLVAYATTGSIHRTMAATHRGQAAVSDILRRYGVPLHFGGIAAKHAAARGWAAEIAERLAA